MRHLRAIAFSAVLVLGAHALAEESKENDDVPQSFMTRQWEKIKARFEASRITRLYETNAREKNAELSDKLSAYIKPKEFRSATALADCSIQLIEKHYNGAESILRGLEFMSSLRDSVLTMKKKPFEKSAIASLVASEAACKKMLADYKQQNRPALLTKRIRQNHLDETQQHILETELRNIKAGKISLTDGRSISPFFAEDNLVSKLLTKSLASKIYQVTKPAVTGLSWAVGAGQKYYFTRTIYETAFGRAYNVTELEIGATAGWQFRVTLEPDAALGDAIRVRDLESSPARVSLSLGGSIGAVWGVSKDTKLLTLNHDRINNLMHPESPADAARQIGGDDIVQVVDAGVQDGAKAAFDTLNSGVNKDTLLNIGAAGDISIPFEYRYKLEYDITPVFAALGLVD